jgi:hypothetical protein
VVPAEPLNTALLSVRFILAFLLLAAAVPKFADRRRFRRSVDDYGVVPSWLVSPVAAATPWIEAGSALALFGGVVVGPVASIDALLMIGFAFAAILNLRRGRRIDCGCFGSVAPRAIGWDLVVLDLACAAMAGALAAAARWPWMAGGSAVPTRSGASDSVAAALLAGMIVAAYLLTVSWLSVRPAVAKLRSLVQGNSA